MVVFLWKQCCNFEVGEVMVQLGLMVQFDDEIYGGSVGELMKLFVGLIATHLFLFFLFFSWQNGKVFIER